MPAAAVSSTPPALPTHTVALGGGVYRVDTGFQREAFDAAYLLVDGGQAAFIDTGTNHSVPRLLQALTGVGLTPADVRWVIPTHVHLDHAGGVGELMRQLPAARLVVHPRGARHLIDPTALYQGALAVYGEAEMQRSYGTLIGVAAERVDTSSDGGTLALGQRTLTLIDSPGHARHHHAVWDPVTRGWFTGDTFGLSYREHDVDGRPWIFPTTTPVQFEPDAMRTSVQRMLDAQPQCVYLTHFGRLEQPSVLAQAMLALLDEVVALGESLRGVSAGAQRHEALRRGLTAIYQRSLREHGFAGSAGRIEADLAIDIELNAQGMGVWLDRA